MDVLRQLNSVFRYGIATTPSDFSVRDAHVTCNSDYGHSAKKPPHSGAVCLWAWFLPSIFHLVVNPKPVLKGFTTQTLLKVHFLVVVVLSITLSSWADGISPVVIEL